jgi:Protein of unknown function (DUF998)
MTEAVRPDPASTPSRNDHVGPSPAPSGAVRPARFAVGTLALRIGTWAQPGQPDRPAELPPAGAAWRYTRRLVTSATRPRRPRHPVPRWAVVSAGLAPVLATWGWLVADAVQPASYSPVRQTVSVLAGHAGTDRWIMTGALFLVGGCQLVTAAGLAGVGTPARILLAVAGLSSIGIAASPEPARGSTPQHLAWTSLGAVAIAVWPALVARRAAAAADTEQLRPGRRDRRVMALLGWLVIETQGGSDLGLAERLFLSTATCWPFIVATTLRQTTG